jgi:hypothetical protein
MQLVPFNCIPAHINGDASAVNHFARSVSVVAVGTQGAVPGGFCHAIALVETPATGIGRACPGIEAKDDCIAQLRLDMFLHERFT